MPLGAQKDLNPQQCEGTHRDRDERLSEEVTFPLRSEEGPGVCLAWTSSRCRRSSGVTWEAVRGRGCHWKALGLELGEGQRMGAGGCSGSVCPWDAGIGRGLHTWARAPSPRPAQNKLFLTRQSCSRMKGTGAQGPWGTRAIWRLVFYKYMLQALPELGAENGSTAAAPWLRQAVFISF